MLEYMLMRKLESKISIARRIFIDSLETFDPLLLLNLFFFRLESKIWDSTKEWLHESEDNRLLIVLDEAHMYRGSAGGEIALLLDRLFDRLEITADDTYRRIGNSKLPSFSAIETMTSNESNALSALSLPNT